MKDLFLTVLEISLSTSLIVVFLLLTSRLLNRRYAVKWKYGIWIALALRLILPFKMSLPQKEIVLDVPARLADPVASSVTVMAVAPEVAQTGAARSLSPLDILAIVWLAGAALFLLTHLLSYAHYRRTVLKHGQRVTDVNVLCQIRSISQELEIRRRMPVIQDITASTPMVIGFVRPILVMPDMEYQPMELYFVLKHELIHLKRGDMFAKLLFVAANAIHWFNPLMYLMQKEAVVDMELSCDERVVKDTVFETRKAYTETLLATLCRTQRKSTALSTQFFGDKTVMKKRFQNIMTRARKKSGLTVLIAVLVAAAVLGAVLGLSVGEPEMEEAQRMLEVANEFKDAYVAGDREAMKAFLADTYEGDLDIQPVTDLGNHPGVYFRGDPQPGDLSIVLNVNPNIRATNTPIGSTFTALCTTSNQPNPVDALRLSFIKQENGWKVRAYELVNNQEIDYNAIMDAAVANSYEATAATEVQPTEVIGYDDSEVYDSPEIPILTGNALYYAEAYVANDREKMESLRAENFVGSASPYSGPALTKSQVLKADVKFAPRIGDIGISANDEISIYDQSVPVGSTMTVLLEVQDFDSRFFVYLIREEEEWKVYDFYPYQDDTQQITQLALDFTNALYSGDKDFANSCMSVISSQRIDETWEDTRFLGIHAVKGVTTYGVPAEEGARATVSVEHRQGEYAEDTYTYLSLTLIKEMGQWKVCSYGLEG